MNFITLQAFVAVVQPTGATEKDKKSKQEIDPLLQYPQNFSS